jgi:hypothetical protein
MTCGDFVQIGLNYKAEVTITPHGDHTFHVKQGHHCLHVVDAIALADAMKYQDERRARLPEAMRYIKEKAA